MFQALRFGSKADMCSAPAHVCYGPKADMRLFDEYIDTPQYVPWNSQAYGLGSFEVDGQLEFRRLFYRYIFRLLALQYSLHKLGRKIGSHRLFSWATAEQTSPLPVGLQR